MVVADVVDASILVDATIIADVVVAVAVGVVPAAVADPSSTVVAAVSNVTFVVVAVSVCFCSCERCCCCDKDRYKFFRVTFYRNFPFRRKAISAKKLWKLFKISF